MLLKIYYQVKFDFKIHYSAIGDKEKEATTYTEQNCCLRGRVRLWINHPFGLAMEGRGYQDTTVYRYGFNGMERDDEWKGEGRSYDFGARIYDPKVGRWLSVDPLALLGPEFSPYSFNFNNPVTFYDPDGMWPEDGVTRPFSQNNVYRNSNGKVVARRITASSRKSMNAGMGIISTFAPGGLALGTFYEGGKALSGNPDGTAIGSTLFSGVLSGAEAIALLGSIDPMVGQNQQMLASGAKNINIFNKVFGVAFALKEIGSPATKQEQLESLTFRFMELSGQANLNYANEGLLQFDNPNLNVETVSKNLNRIYDVLNDSIGGFNLTTEEGIKAAKGYLNDNLKSIFEEVKNRDLNNY